MTHEMAVAQAFLNALYRPLGSKVIVMRGDLTVATYAMRRLRVRAGGQP